MRVIRLRQIRLQLASLLVEAVLDERETLRRAKIRLACRLHNLSGNGAGKGIELIIVRLEEAPLHLGIVGEGLAALVVDADGLALIEGHILFRSQIETEIVAICGCYHLARRILSQKRRCG